MCMAGVMVWIESGHVYQTQVVYYLEDAVAEMTVLTS